MSFFVATYAIAQLRPDNTTVTATTDAYFVLQGDTWKLWFIARPLAALVAAVVAAALLAACTQTTSPQPSSTNPYAALSALKAEAAADLTMPGSSLIRNVGAEGFMNITGWQAAFYGHVYGTQQAIDDVLAY